MVDVSVLAVEIHVECAINASAAVPHYFQPLSLKLTKIFSVARLTPLLCPCSHLHFQDSNQFHSSRGACRVDSWTIDHANLILCYQHIEADLHIRLGHLIRSLVGFWTSEQESGLKREQDHPPASPSSSIQNVVQRAVPDRFRRCQFKLLKPSRGNTTSSLFWPFVSTKSAIQFGSRSEHRPWCYATREELIISAVTEEFY